MLSLILVIVAIVLFGLAALRVSSPRFDFVAAGLALWALSQIVGGR